MARYDYKCSKCEHLFEVTHSIHEDPKIKCEKCKAISTRQIPTRINLYGTVGVDWNTDPSKVSKPMRDKAKKASKRKVKF
tara:strand:- start:175 stop:414 length:240 start_codon:yes stop_codon:yes gene_type:complete